MFILMLIAIYGIIGELTTPGAILPGVVGAIALILALYLAAILPVNVTGLVLIVLALMLFVLGSMTLTLVGSSVLILAVAHAQGVQTTAWTSSAGLSAWLAFFGNEVLCLIGICLLGMLIAILTRSTGIAVGVALAYVLVPEGIIAMVWQSGSRWFPIRTFNFLPGSVFPTDVGPIPPQGYAAALLVALLWMTVFVVGSFVVFRRQDINA